MQIRHACRSPRRAQACSRPATPAARWCNARSELLVTFVYSNIIMKMSIAQDFPTHQAPLSLLPTRRGLLALAVGAAFAGRRAAAAEPTVGEDGLYHEPWFLQSFLDLREDLESAAAGGKRLAIMWELR